MIHELADVQSMCIGENTNVWQFTVILKGARIGDNCNINCHVFIENDVVLGNSITIKSGVYLWDGIRIEDYVFVGPNVSFTNDKYPRSKQYPQSFDRTIIRKGASIGAAATILGGVEIGENALVAAGALVTQNVPARALVMGAPAKVAGWMDENGVKMKELGDNDWKDSHGNIWVQRNNEIMRK